MRFNKIIAYLWFVAPFILCCIAVAQDKPVAKVELKPEVKVELLQDQNAIYKLAIQMKQLESQYVAAQQEFTKLQSKLQLDTKGAIVKSGIDETKYEINAETFDVTAKPVVADAKK